MSIYVFYDREKKSLLNGIRNYIFQTNILRLIPKNSKNRKNPKGKIPYDWGRTCLNLIEIEFSMFYLLCIGRLTLAKV